jgi:hypothetical protein
LKAQGLIYWSGDKLWKRAIDAKRELLNEFHATFCQEVNPSWPKLPSGKLIADLMEDLRKTLFTKKALELKEDKIKRAEKKVQGAHAAVEQAQTIHGPDSQEYQAEQVKRDCALRDLQIAKDEEPAEYDAAWYPTLWKAYTAFGPSMESPHGHGGFLSPSNGTCLTAGPLSPEIAAPKNSDGGRAAARKRAREATTPTTQLALDERMVTAFEASVDLLARSEERKDKNVEMERIRAMLNECGQYMSSEEKTHWGRRLMSLYLKDIQGNGAAQGEGGSGV